MPVILKLTGTHPALAGAELKRLFELLIGQTATDSGDSRPIRVRILPDSFSGSVVGLVWPTGRPPVIIKAGPSDAIAREFENQRRWQRADEAAKSAHLIGPVTFDLDGTPKPWSAINLPYIGGLSYETLEDYGDFVAFFKSFVTEQDRDRTHPTATVRACLREAATALTAGVGVERETTGHPLHTYMPDVDWSNSIGAMLETASSLWPDIEELNDFPNWYESRIEAMTVAPVADERDLHGDARLANFLVDSLHAKVHLIDYGNVRRGHVFEDLSRFELDLIISTATRGADGTLVQDELFDVAYLALRDDFSLNDIEVQTRQGACLKLWRQELAAVMPGATLPGAALMYRWFLLNECLRRLRWVGRNGATAANVDAWSILSLVAMLRSRLSGASPQSVPVSTTGDALRAMYCRAAFVPTEGRERLVNEKRNDAKRRTLAAATKQRTLVRLIAETGQSYLSPRGVFSSQVRELLASGGTLQVITCNPFFLEAQAVSIGHTVAIEPVTGPPQINDDVRSKFSESYSGYQLLRERYGTRVEVRVARYGLAATVLISEHGCFFEPYFRSVRRRRQELLFDTFELWFEPGGDHARRLLNETFAFHWSNSDSIDEICRHESDWRALAAAVFETWPTK